MHARSRFVVAALAAVAAVGAGCLGRAGEPPRPTRSIAAEQVGVAERWAFGTCGHFLVTLRSGDAIDVLPPGSSAAGCPVEVPTDFLIGSSSSLTSGSDDHNAWVDEQTAQAGDAGSGPLVLRGTADGRAWVGVIPALPTGGPGCWQFRFAMNEGAYLEGRAFHLVNGLVLPMAADYRPYAGSGDPFPLRASDGLCLNEAGEVRSVDVFAPY